MATSSLVQQTQVQVVQQQATADDVSIKTETAGAATATLVAGADGTLTTVPAGQPTVQFATVQGATAAATSGQQIQYVIQLPATSSSSSGQPFQIQMLPQQFQTTSTDAVATAQVGGTLIAGTSAATGGLQVVQVVNSQGPVHPSSSTAAVTTGASTDATNKLQTVHVQLSDLASGAQTLLVQPSGAVVVASSAAPTDEALAANAQASTTLVSVDGGETYTTAQVFSTTTASASAADGQTTAATTSPDARVLQAPTATGLEHVDAPQKMEEPSTDV